MVVVFAAGRFSRAFPALGAALVWPLVVGVDLFVDLAEKKVDETTLLLSYKKFYGSSF